MFLCAAVGYRAGAGTTQAQGKATSVWMYTRERREMETDITSYIVEYSVPLLRFALAPLTTVKLHRKAHTDASDVCKPIAWVKYPTATQKPISMPAIGQTKREGDNSSGVLDEPRYLNIAS